MTKIDYSQIGLYKSQNNIPVLPRIDKDKHDSH